MKTGKARAAPTAMLTRSRTRYPTGLRPWLSRSSSATTAGCAPSPRCSTRRSARRCSSCSPRPARWSTAPGLASGSRHDPGPGSRDVALALVLAGVPMLLILAEPALGIALVVAVLALTTVAVAGAPGRWVVGLLAAVSVGAVLLAQLHLLKPYQVQLGEQDGTDRDGGQQPDHPPAGGAGDRDRGQRQHRHHEGDAQRRLGQDQQHRDPGQDQRERDVAAARTRVPA